MPVPAEREPKSPFPKAPEGTYAFFEQHDWHWPNLNDLKGKTTPYLKFGKEVVCQETGGSCIDIELTVVMEDGRHGYDVHITDQDQLVRVEEVAYAKSFPYPTPFPIYSGPARIDVSEILKKAKEALAEDIRLIKTNRTPEEILSLHMLSKASLQNS